MKLGSVVGLCFGLLVLRLTTYSKHRLLHKDDTHVICEKALDWLHNNLDDTMFTIKMLRLPYGAKVNVAPEYTDDWKAYIIIDVDHNFVGYSINCLVPRKYDMPLSGAWPVEKITSNNIIQSLEQINIIDCLLCFQA